MRLLLTWILLGSMQTLRCVGEVCQPVPSATIEAHRLSTFETAERCEEYRRMFAAQPMRVVRSPSKPDFTVRKVLTYTCKQGVLP